MNFFISKPEGIFAKDLRVGSKYKTRHGYFSEKFTRCSRLKSKKLIRSNLYKLGWDDGVNGKTRFTRKIYKKPIFVLCS
jgi:hypothetical protein